MKKIILSLALVLGCLTFANAQQNALGLKWGTYGTDLSYQRFLNNSNRLEFNLGMRTFEFNRFTASALYQWVWNINGGFNWYAGGGAGVAFGEHIDFGLNILGNIGIEYNFNFPLQLAFDYTPSLLGITPRFGHTYFGNDGIRFAARWRF